MTLLKSLYMATGLWFALQQKLVSAESSVMGPVAFLWPEDRTYSSAYDNVGPCGTYDYSATNRTEFPLSQGHVALTIADEAWNVEFNMAFVDQPLLQSDFTEQVVSNVSILYPGHQCYTLDALPSNLTASDNATIQIKYWSNDSDKNQTFYACADITFVEDEDFTTYVPCFNATVSDSSSTTSSSGIASATGTTNAAAKSTSSSGLSRLDKAGIAVGSVVGGLTLIGASVFLVLYRRRNKAKATKMNPAKEIEETESIDH